ncbi:MAG: sulfotransferase domain-containing protein [Phycisphaerales bacterium JB039]
MSDLVSLAMRAGRRVLGDAAMQARFRRLAQGRMSAPDQHTIVVQQHGRQIAYRFFFVLGYGKSGTNWLGAVLNLHPHIWCDGEFHLQAFTEAARRFTGPDYAVGHREPYRTLAEEGARDLIRRLLLAGAARRPSARWIGDRSPRAFEALLPTAPHIYLVRDGRDVAVSWTYHHLRARRGENLWWWPPEMRALLERWIPTFDSGDAGARDAAGAMLAEESWVRFTIGRWAEQLRADREAMEAARAAGTPVEIVRYESLHADMDATRERLYRLLGLDPALAAPASAHDGTSPGFEVERPSAFRRRGAVGDWRNYSPDIIRRVYEDLASDLEDFGPDGALARMTAQ